MRQLAGMYSEPGNEDRRLAVDDAIYEHGALTRDTELLNLAYMWLRQEAPYKAGRIIETGMQKGVIPETPQDVETLANAWAQASEYRKAIPTLTRAAELSGSGVLQARLAGVFSMPAITTRLPTRRPRPTVCAG